MRQGLFGQLDFGRKTNRQKGSRGYQNESRSEIYFRQVGRRTERNATDYSKCGGQLQDGFGTVQCIASGATELSRAGQQGGARAAGSGGGRQRGWRSRGRAPGALRGGASAAEGLARQVVRLGRPQGFYHALERGDDLAAATGRVCRKGLVKRGAGGQACGQQHAGMHWGPSARPT